jgi:hypothetical protein
MQEIGCVDVFWDENATFWANIVIIGMRYHISKSTKFDPLFGSSLQWKVLTYLIYKFDLLFGSSFMQ